MDNRNIYVILMTSLVLLALSKMCTEVACSRREDLLEVTAISLLTKIWNETVQREWNHWIHSQQHIVPRCKMTLKVDYNLTRVPAVIVKVKHCSLDVSNRHGFHCQKEMKQITVTNLETKTSETENIPIACHTVRMPSTRTSSYPSRQMNTYPLPYPRGY